MKKWFVLIVVGILFSFLVMAELDVGYNNPSLPKVIVEVPEDITNLSFTSVNVSDWWLGTIPLDDESDIATSLLNNDAGFISDYDNATSMCNYGEWLDGGGECFNANTTIDLKLSSGVNGTFENLNITGTAYIGELTWDGNLNMSNNNITNINTGFFERIAVGDIGEPEYSIHIRSNVPYIAFNESDENEAFWRIGMHDGYLKILGDGTHWITFQNNTGNVGIGIITSPPNQKLVVDGNVNFTGNLTLNKPYALDWGNVTNFTEITFNTYNSTWDVGCSETGSCSNVAYMNYDNTGDFNTTNINATEINTEKIKSVSLVEIYPNEQIAAYAFFNESGGDIILDTYEEGPGSPNLYLQSEMNLWLTPIGSVFVSPTDQVADYAGFTVSGGDVILDTFGAGDLYIKGDDDLILEPDDNIILQPPDTIYLLPVSNKIGMIDQTTTPDVAVHITSASHVSAQGIFKVDGGSNHGFLSLESGTGKGIGFIFRPAGVSESYWTWVAGTPNYTGLYDYSLVDYPIKMYDDGGIVFSDVYGKTVTSNVRSLYIDDAGEIGGISSSRSSKENIKNTTNTDWIYDLNVVDFDYIDGSKNQTGMIAEDVELIEPRLISYKREKIKECKQDNETGMGEICDTVGVETTNIPETINYGNPILISSLIQEIQNLKERIEVLEKE